MKKKFKDLSFTVIGGGTGTFSVLSGLKHYTDKITAIVSMSDSGGSAKKEKDEWGLLPSSDIRKSLIALSDVGEEDGLLLRKLFQYRYDSGIGVSGMTFGNLFLVALTKLLGNQSAAIEKASQLLRVKGRVLPVTFNTVDLAATYEDGSFTLGEHNIDEPAHNSQLKITKLETKPQAIISQQAKDAIIQSDVIIIGPGGFYTTILANLVVKGVPQAIYKSRAKKIFILNLMTEYGQTFGFTASQFINELHKYFNVNILDYVFINNTTIPSKILDKYRESHAVSVINDLPHKTPYKVISADILSKRAVKIEKGDSLKRSFIRHSSDKIAKLCIKILK